MRVKGEGGAVPVATGAQLAQLAEDDPAVLVAPLPHLLDELFPPEVAAVQALLAQLFLDPGLGRDAGVVGAGKPQRVHPDKAGAAHEDILQSVVEDVPHVQHAGDVGRRDHDAIGIPALAGLPTKRPGLLPEPVPAVLNRFRLIGFLNHGHGAPMQSKSAYWQPPFAGESKKKALPESGRALN